MAAPSRHATRRNFGPLTVGTVVSGLAAYGFIALGTRAVGEELFAPVSVLWSLWALMAAAVSFPVQHWFIRSAEVEGEPAVWATIPRILAGVAALSVLAGVLATVAGEALFRTSPGAFAVMTGLLPLGSLAMGLQRGVLARRGRFTGVAATLAGENLVRAAVSLAVLLLGSGTASDATLLGWGIIAGFGVVLVYGRALVPVGGEAQERPSFQLLGGFAGANVGAQLALTSGPILVALLRAPSATVTQVFAILALLRVPYTGLVGTTSAITGPLTRLVNSDHRHRLRRWEVIGAVVVVLLAATAALLAPVVLPPVVQAVFGATITISPAAQSALAAGGVLAIAGLLEMLILLAVHRARRLLGAWIAGIAVGGVCLLAPATPVLRVCVAFLAAEATALTVMAARRPSPTPGDSDDR